MVSGHRDRSCDPQIVIFDKQPEEDCMTDFDKWISDWTDKRTNSESEDKLILTPLLFFLIVIQNALCSLHNVK